MGPLTSQTKFSRMETERYSLSVLVLNLPACWQMAYLHMSGTSNHVILLLMWRKRAGGKWHKILSVTWNSWLPGCTHTSCCQWSWHCREPTKSCLESLLFLLSFSLTFLTSPRCPKPQFPLAVQVLLYAPNSPNRALPSFVSPLLLGLFSAMV